MMPATNDGTRRARGQRTRQAILDAARDQFHRLGYDAASIRGIAAAADIDPSMVMRYYGSKEGLFAAAVDVDLRLPDLSGVPPGELGHRLVEHFIARWEGDPADDVLVLLLRSAVTNEAARARMVTVFAEQLMHVGRRGQRPRDGDASRHPHRQPDARVGPVPLRARAARGDRRTRAASSSPTWDPRCSGTSASRCLRRPCDVGRRLGEVLAQGMPPVVRGFCSSSSIGVSGTSRRCWDCPGRPPCRCCSAFWDADVCTS